MRTRQALLFVLILLFVWIGYRKFGLQVGGKTAEVGSSIVEKSVDTITNQVFEELTIPYLAKRSYDSDLGEKKLYQTSPAYNTYLTSYISDGLKINGLLTIPKGEAPIDGWPAVVFVHGYIPPDTYKTTEKYIDYVNSLAKSGLVVFKIDLRGHGESEGEAGGAYYSSDYVVDTLNAYRAIQKIPEVNKNKVYLWGHSMAGNVLFRSVVVEKKIPKVVIWAGAVYSYSDFVKYGLSDNSYRPVGISTARQSGRQKIFDTYGQFSESIDFWKKVSGVNYLDGVNTIFQIHHAVDDNVVNVGYSRDLKSILDDKKIPVLYYEYKSGGHNINGSSFSEAMRRTVEFLKQ